MGAEHALRFAPGRLFSAHAQGRASIRTSRYREQYVGDAVATRACWIPFLSELIERGRSLSGSTGSCIGLSSRGSPGGGSTGSL